MPGGVQRTLEVSHLGLQRVNLLGHSHVVPLTALRPACSRDPAVPQPTCHRARTTVNPSFAGNVPARINFQAHPASSRCSTSAPQPASPPPGWPSAPGVPAPVAALPTRLSCDPELPGGFWRSATTTRLARGLVYPPYADIRRPPSAPPPSA